MFSRQLRKYRAYLAGPMTGIPRLNAPAFNAAAEQLRAIGYDVFNPTDNSDLGGCSDLPRAVYIRRDIQALLRCDLAVMLPEWLNEGPFAVIEHHIHREIARRNRL